MKSPPSFSIPFLHLLFFIPISLPILNCFLIYNSKAKEFPLWCRGIKSQLQQLQDSCSGTGVRSPAWHTGLNDMALLQLWLGLGSWPGNFHMSHCSHKKKFVFLWYSGLLFPWNFSCGSAVPFFLRFSLPLLRSCFLTPASAVHHSHTGVPREFHPNSSTGISPHPRLCGPISSQGFSNCL